MFSAVLVPPKKKKRVQTADLSLQHQVQQDSENFSAQFTNAVEDLKFYLNFVSNLVSQSLARFPPKAENLSYAHN